MFDARVEAADFGRVEASSGIRVRSEPSSYGEVLGVVPDDALLVLLERDGDWSMIRHGSSVGYVKNEWVHFDTLQNCVFSYTSPDGFASYRIGHTLEEYRRGQLATAERADAEEDIVVCTGRDDWLLNVREAPDADSTVLGMLPNGTQIQPLLTSGEWSMVECGGVRGYIMNRFISPRSEADDDQGLPVVQNLAVQRAVVWPEHGSQAQIFDADSDDAEVLGSLKGGVHVDVIESREDGWSCISLNGHQGYIRDEDLRFLNDKGR